MKTITLDPVRFLKAGGFLSLAEWIQLSRAEQDDMVKAAEQLRGEYAERVADEIVGALAALGEEEQLTEMVDKALKEQE